MPPAAATSAAPAVCIACGTVPRESFMLRNGAPLLRCPQCGMGWWAWPEFDPASFYDRDYFQSAEAEKGYDDYASLEEGVRRTARARLKQLARMLDTKAPRIFEIGCGTGVFLDEARAAGAEVTGIEVSAYAAARAREAGLAVQCGSMENAAIPASTYDAVVLWDVIEHLRDPASVLQSAANALRPGGVLALSTGDITSTCARLSGASWHLFNLPEHLFFFSPSALRALVERCGCRVSRIRTEINWVPVAYLVERLRKSAGRRNRRQGAVAGTRRSSRWVVPASLGDVVGVYAIRSSYPD